MELERAFDTLGLEPGASAEDVEAAYRRLCDDFDARIGRVTSRVLRDRYAGARAELEAARALALRACEATPGEVGPEDPDARTWHVLGLRPDASPLEVASAYVSLCEELDRELESAPTEGLRRRCLEARAEIDRAYQHCAAAPLAAEPGRPGAALYETQVASATFEAPDPPLPALGPARIALIEPDPPPRRRRPRRRTLRRLALAASVLLFGAAGSLGYVWWTDPEEVQWLVRYLPLPPDPDLVEAQTAAEYLRRRVAEERQDIARRAELAADRVTRLRAKADVEGEPGESERGRASLVLDRAEARTALARHLHDLTERHVFSSSALAEAYGHMELASELAAEGEIDRAVAAYTEARMHLEATLASLDDAESALGSRYEAVDARDAWVALAASAGLSPGDAVRVGGQRLAEADELLEAGNFAAAIPELRRASQSFRQAFDDGRRVLAARREAFEAEGATRDPGAAASADEAPLAGAGLAGVSSGPPLPVSGHAEVNAEVKLVTIPSGSFLYGCNGIVDRECPASEPGRRADLPAFRIDRTEVRVSEYAACVAAGACTPPGLGAGCNGSGTERGDHPVNCVDWDQAAAYCGWVGKRLPTEEEWEKAARGTDGRIYPWGNESASCDVAVMSADDTLGCGGGSTAPVASRDRGRSPYGLFDMAGNVLEWTGSPHESTAGARVLRGGSWQNSALAMRSSHREAAQPTLRHESVGFRCAQGAVVAGNGAP